MVRNKLIYDYLQNYGGIEDYLNEEPLTSAKEDANMLISRLMSDFNQIKQVSDGIPTKICFMKEIYCIGSLAHLFLASICEWRANYR